ncbi:ABC transporter permease [Eubacterium barkeri]|uniref:Putative ABC transport system permease protein n=1 Tax=Eubacterium barkeri TaxID=1528 RepID=A0A1H3EMK2_EUBBA|nr:ABC transporter permease [Eubacterium barkeri]SDX79159.1 putative ABC transport system permease protein [Eubacterium barkeri]
MNLRENIILAIEGLTHNKMRALLTMLGIIIGIASVIAIASMGDAMSRSFSESLNKVGGKIIMAYVGQKDPEAMVSTTNSDLITDDMIANFKAHFPNDIKSVGVSVPVGSGTLDDLKHTEVKLTGVNDDYLSTQNLKIQSGRTLSAEDNTGGRRVTLISNTLAQTFFGREDALGESLTVRTKNGNESFRVIGIYTDPKSEDSGSLMSVSFGNSSVPELFIPTSLAENLSGSNNTGYSTLNIIAYPSADSNALSQSISTWFGTKYYASNPDFTVKTENIDKYANESKQMLGSLSTAIGVIAGISLLVGGIGVMNIMLVSVTERTREIGIRKALGASNTDIRIQFIVESIIICIIGGAIGVLVGSGLGAIGGIFIKAAVTPTLSSILIAVGFSMGIGVFFGYYPAGKAAKLNPIDALRYE